MTLITNEVFDYMLDDIQRSTTRSISKMNDVVQHLELREGLLKDGDKYKAKAVEIQNTLKLAATLIDSLPALGADLEALAGAEPEVKKDAAVIVLTNAEAVAYVGPRMTRGALEKALLDHYDAESVSYNLHNDTFSIYMKEEQKS